MEKVVDEGLPVVPATRRVGEVPVVGAGDLPPTQRGSEWVGALDRQVLLPPSPGCSMHRNGLGSSQDAQTERTVASRDFHKMVAAAAVAPPRLRSVAEPRTAVGGSARSRRPVPHHLVPCHRCRDPQQTRVPQRRG